jgi:hypothetical protein
LEVRKGGGEKWDGAAFEDVAVRVLEEQPAPVVEEGERRGEVGERKNRLKVGRLDLEVWKGEVGRSRVQGRRGMRVGGAAHICGGPLARGIAPLARRVMAWKAEVRKRKRSYVWGGGRSEVHGGDSCHEGPAL